MAGGLYFNTLDRVPSRGEPIQHILETEIEQ